MTDTTVSTNDQAGESAAQAEAAQALPESDASEGSTKGLVDWFQVLICGAVSLAICIISLTAYHFLSRHRYAVIDLASVVEIQEMKFMAMLTRPDVSDADRNAAYDLVKTTGTQIEKSIAEIKKECGCVIMARGAFVGEADYDLTPRLKEKMGLDKVDVDTLKALVMSNAMPSGIAPPQTGGAQAGGAKPVMPNFAVPGVKK